MWDIYFSWPAFIYEVYPDPSFTFCFRFPQTNREITLPFPPAFCLLYKYCLLFFLLWSFIQEKAQNRQAQPVHIEAAQRPTGNEHTQQRFSLIGQLAFIWMRGFPCLCAAFLTFFYVKVFLSVFLGFRNSVWYTSAAESSDKERKCCLEHLQLTTPSVLRDIYLSFSGKVHLFICVISRTLHRFRFSTFLLL